MYITLLPYLYKRKCIILICEENYTFLVRMYLMLTTHLYEFSSSIQQSKNLLNGINISSFRQKYLFADN